MQWDLDGTGTFAVTDNPEPNAAGVLDRQCSFSTTGTHFVTVRVISQRDADTADPYTRVANLARACVVVS